MRHRRIVVIPDAHASPSYSNARFDWLGAFVKAAGPSAVVCLGDWADMSSLSSHDRGKLSFEGRRYKRDIESANDALERFHSKAGSGVELHMCLGNHEARISKACQDHGELDGVIGVSDIRFKEHGWRVYPFQSVLKIAGFSVSHHLPSGVMGKPIGGQNHAASLARLTHGASIVGHSHLVDFAVRTRPDGSRFHSFVAGCYTHPDQSSESWCAATGKMWSQGVLVLDDVCDGDVGGFHFVSQKSIKREHS